MTITKAFMIWAAGIFLCLLYGTGGHAADVSFEWDKSPETDLSGYMIHYGPVSGQYTGVQECGLPEPVNEKISCTVESAPDKKTFYAATAHDAAGNSSDYSNEVVYNAPPATVTGFTAITVSINVTMSR